MAEKLWPDLILALGIMLALFWMMIAIAQTAADVEPPVHETECQDRYQLSTKEVLRCDQTGRSDG